MVAISYQALFMAFWCATKPFNTSDRLVSLKLEELHTIIVNVAGSCLGKPSTNRIQIRKPIISITISNPDVNRYSRVESVGRKIIHVSHHFLFEKYKLDDSLFSLSLLSNWYFSLFAFFLHVLFKTFFNLSSYLSSYMWRAALFTSRWSPDTFLQWGMFALSGDSKCFDFRHVWL